MMFVGEGWGKSAAAYGYATRSAGRGWETMVVQFVKGGAWNPAEREVATQVGIEWPSFTNALTWAADDPAVLGERAWSSARSAIESGRYGLVVLDELTHAVASGWVSETDVLETLRARAATTSVIITGRSASRRLRAMADTITRFDLVKHREKRGILE